ncbi:MAG: DUF5320 domain-containing protein [Candidatus Omnitrophica bacterium]|nr:DUF5320 domain-containing protein [Candidatus Omnitrophota bacterium]
MPGGDRTGPLGQGQARGWGQGSRPGAGAGGFCVCPSCKEKVAHQRGVPCTSVNCPKCGASMTRE